MNTAAKIVPKENWRIPDWFVDLTPQQVDLLKRLHFELCRFNNNLNLVSPKTIPAADAIHFADSILASRLINKDKPIDTLYDIGSGAGFPGLIYAILYPQTKVILVESDAKKCEFLKTFSDATSLKNVSIHSEQVETLPDSKITFCMTRGFATVSKSIFVLRKIVKKGGSLYMLKAEEWASEVSQMPVQLCAHWKPSLVSNYKLPIGDINMSLIKLDKISD